MAPEAYCGRAWGEGVLRGFATCIVVLVGIVGVSSESLVTTNAGAVCNDVAGCREYVREMCKALLGPDCTVKDLIPPI